MMSFIGNKFYFKGDNYEKKFNFNVSVVCWSNVSK